MNLHKNLKKSLDSSFVLTQSCVSNQLRQSQALIEKLAFKNNNYTQNDNSQKDLRNIEVLKLNEIRSSQTPLKNKDSNLSLSRFVKS